MKIRLYGAFQDGTRISRISTDVCFGDRIICETLRKNLSCISSNIDFILPDDNERLAEMSPKDVLVIGGGGLIHPELLNVSGIKACKARKAVFGVGINWDLTTPYWTIRRLSEIVERCFRDIPFICVRDWQTKAFLRMDRVRVCPDVIFLNWDKNVKTGSERAVIDDFKFKKESNETSINFHKIHAKEGSEIITSLDQLKRFGSIRTLSYHGMLAPLVLGSNADVTIVNVKQEAFLLSYWDKLNILGHEGNRIIMSCADPEFMFNMVHKEFLGLMDYIKSK